MPASIAMYMCHGTYVPCCHLIKCMCTHLTSCLAAKPLVIPDPDSTTLVAALSSPHGMQLQLHLPWARTSTDSSQNPSRTCTQLHSLATHMYISYQHSTDKLGPAANPKQTTYASLTKTSSWTGAVCRAWLMPQTCPQLRSPLPSLLAPQWAQHPAPGPAACRSRTCPVPASHVQPAAARTATRSKLDGDLTQNTKPC